MRPQAHTEPFMVIVSLITPFLQVGPALLVLGEVPREYGLKASLLERLKAHYRQIGKGNRLQAFLMKNFRCHQHILRFASEMFYKSLVTPSQVTLSGQSHPNYPFPLVFVCTSKEVVNQYDKAVNRDEAGILMSMLGKDLEIKQKEVNVCVMSSSRGQVSNDIMCSKYVSTQVTNRMHCKHWTFCYV